MVASFSNLAPGELRSFSGTYIVPTNACSLLDTVTATGFDACGDLVSDGVTSLCGVADIQPPAIVCPGNLVFTADPGRCSRSNVIFAITATDNCSVPVVFSIPPSGSTFPVGTNLVRGFATDLSGNQSTCTFTVTVTKGGSCSINSSDTVTFKDGATTLGTVTVSGSGNSAAASFATSGLSAACF